MTDNSMPNVTNFVHDLVAMAKATEELPIVRSALQNETEHANRLAQTVQDREASIMGLKEQLEAVHAKLRAAEAERDDAELRFLEADEKASKVLNLVRSVQSALGETVVTLEPPKAVAEPMNDHPPQGEVKPEVVHTVDPTPVDFPHTVAPMPTSVLTDVTEHVSEHHTPIPPAPGYVTNPTVGTEVGSIGTTEVPKADTSTAGQSEPFPTSHSPSPDSSSSGQVASEQSLDSQPKEVAGPYVGVKYWHQGRYISRADWLAGGGSNEDYDWHPTT